MALFALREGYRVETTPTGGRVVHVRTGDTLELNFSEIQLLARAAAGGLQTDDPALRPILRKLSALGLIERIGGGPETATSSPVEPLPPEGASVEPGLWVFAPPQASGPSSPEATTQVADLSQVSPSTDDVRALSSPPIEPDAAQEDEVKLEFAEQPMPDDEPAPLPGIPVAEPPAAAATADPRGEQLVPLFRADLALKRKGKGGVYSVSDPKSGKAFDFYDFEISISRMLNGKRTYLEVVKAANGLGIPVSVESLAQFIRQLERYGYLAPAGTPAKTPAPGSIWGKRAKWNDSIRTLFQSGLKLTRQARYYEAAAYFEAILEHDPDNPEAVEMVQQVRAQLAKIPPGAPAPKPPAGLSAAEHAAGEPEVAAAESSLESLDGSIAEPEPSAVPAETVAAELPIPPEAYPEPPLAPEAAQPPPPPPPPPEPVEAEPKLEFAEPKLEFAEAPPINALPGAVEATPESTGDPLAGLGQTPTEITDVAAHLASLPKPSGAAPEPLAPGEMPDEPPPFDPGAEPLVTVQPLGLNEPPPEAHPLEQTFDPFTNSKTQQRINTPDPFPAAAIKTRAPTLNPFARPADLGTEAPRTTPDPFAASKPSPQDVLKGSTPTSIARPAGSHTEPAPFDPFADHDALLTAEPELPMSVRAPPPSAKPLPPPPPPPTPELKLGSPIPVPLPAGGTPGAEPKPEPRAAVVEQAAKPAAAEPPKAQSLAEMVDQAAQTLTDEPRRVPGSADLTSAIAEIVAEQAAAESPAPAPPAPAQAKPPSSPSLSVPPTAPAVPPTAPAVEPPGLEAKPGERRSNLHYAGLGVGVAAAALFGFWFFVLRAPSTTEAPPKPVVAVQPDARAAGPDAAAAAIEPAAPDASAEEAKADAALAAAAGLDASSQPAGPDAAAAGPDASAPKPDAAVAAAPGSEEGWVAVEVVKRGRVNMGDLKAPIGGQVTWAIGPLERVRKGELVGKITGNDGNDVVLVAPNVGLLGSKTGDQAEVQAGAVIASIPYFEAYGQANFAGPAAPTPDWECEVVDEAGTQKAPCKVNKAEPRKTGFYVTFTTEPLWFDTAAKIKVRLKAK